MRTFLMQKPTQARVEAERAAVTLAAVIASGLANDAPPHMIDGATRQFEQVEREALRFTDDGAVMRVFAPLGEAIRTAARTRDPDDIRRLFDLVSAIER
jgi:hypothetical protein